METDQYNLPPVPLADIAPEVEAYVAENIQAAIDKLNAEIAKHEACLQGNPSPAFGTHPPSTVTEEGPRRKIAGCRLENSERAKLAELRSPNALAAAVYERLGAGTVFVTNAGNWLTTHKFEHEPARYKAPYSESIYLVRPINYATLSPTIRMYGVEFGTDKLDHFFQQGYKYYTKWAKAIRSGKTDADGLKSAVSWGRSTENLFFGYAVSGVYSNADLYANYAGLRFYQALTSDVKDGYVNWPSAVKLYNGRWEINESVKGALLRPFIADHLNEALNPSNYLPLLYPLVKSAVKKHACSEWRAALPNMTHEELVTRTAVLETWKGEDYGFKRTSRMVRIADVCFANDKKN
jgi:hypothetical protein